MGRRADEMRRKERRVLAWSFAAAVVIHGVVFVAFPTLRAEPLVGGDVELDTTGVAGGGNASVSVFFGPPTVKVAGGDDWTAPPERVLPADRAVLLQGACRALAERAEPLSGRVGLRIRDSGRVDVLGLVTRSGDPCADRVLTEVAGDLWYHWLPNERFPAPVEVEQPVTLVSTTLAAF